MPIGSCEVFVPYGGDVVFTSNGDRALVIDTAGNPAATLLRVQRLLMTSPRQLATDGSPISCGDDLCAPGYGAGLRQIVGEMDTSALEAEVTTRVLKGLAAMPEITQTPAPVVTVTYPQPGSGIFFVKVECFDNQGDLITTPSMPVGIPLVGG